MLLIRNRYYSDYGLDYVFDRLTAEFESRGVAITTLPAPLFGYYSLSEPFFANAFDPSLSNSQIESGKNPKRAYLDQRGSASFSHASNHSLDSAYQKQAKNDFYLGENELLRLIQKDTSIGGFVQIDPKSEQVKLLSPDEGNLKQKKHGKINAEEVFPQPKLTQAHKKKGEKLVNPQDGSTLIEDDEFYQSQVVNCINNEYYPPKKRTNNERANSEYYPVNQPYGEVDYPARGGEHGNAYNQASENSDEALGEEDVAGQAHLLAKEAREAALKRILSYNPKQAGQRGTTPSDYKNSSKNAFQKLKNPSQSGSSFAPNSSSVGRSDYGESHPLGAQKSAASHLPKQASGDETEQIYNTLDFLSLLEGERAVVIYDRNSKQTRILGLKRAVIFWDKDVRLARMLEAAGIRLFPNCADCLAVCDDKELTYARLLGSGVPVIKTFASPLVYDVNAPLDGDFLDLVEMSLGYPIVVKENVGSQGKQVYLAKDRRELERLNQGLMHVPHIYQEFRGEFGTDIRVYVLGGEAVAAVRRINTTSFKSNVSLGGDMEMHPLDERLRKLSKKVSSRLHLEYGSVDFLHDEDGYIFVEANSNAYFKGIEGLGVPMAELLTDHIIERMSK